MVVIVVVGELLEWRWDGGGVVVVVGCNVVVVVGQL